MTTYFTVYQPNGHCVWETLHFDRRACLEYAPIEHMAAFGENLTWRQMYRRGYRCVRVQIKKVRP